MSNFVVLENTNTTVVSVHDPKLIQTQIEEPVVVEVVSIETLTTGQQGPQGIPGQSDNFVYLVSDLTLGGNRVVAVNTSGNMTNAPYSGITVTYYGSDQNKTIGGGSYPFRVVINGNNATLEQIYTKVQYLLRQDSDIDAGAGTVNGKTAAALLAFVGDTLTTTQGVFVENLLSADTNRIEFKDQNNVTRTYPYTASGTITFNTGVGTIYRLMFTAPPGAGNNYGESGAVTVNDASGTPITGTTAGSTVDFTFDYDGNTQAGFTAATDRPVTLIGVKPGSGKFAVATGTLTRSKAISLSLVAETDRVYA